MNKVQSPNLIKILGCDNFLRTLIKFSLPIILHLYFIRDINFPLSKKSCLHIFSRFYTFIYMISGLTFYPIMISIFLR